MRLRVQAVVLCVLVMLGACKKAQFGAPGELVVVRHAGVAKGPDGLNVAIVEKYAEDDPVLLSAKGMLETQFASEVLKVHAQGRAYISRQKNVDEALKRLLQQPAAVVLGAPAGGPQVGLMWQQGEGNPQPLPDVLWMPIPASESGADTGAFEQALAGAVGQLTMRLFLHPALQKVPSWHRGSLGPHPWLPTDPMSALIHGYGLHQETLARRYSRSGKLNTLLAVESADPTTSRIAAVTTNRYTRLPPPASDVLKTPEERNAYLKRWMAQTPPLKGPLWRGSQMMAVPGVVANVLNLLADDPSVALEVPPNPFFAPFHGGKLPADFNVKALHASQLGELKLLHAAWARLSDKDSLPYPGGNALAEAFGAEFPEQRAAALKALISATFARTATTASAGGVEGAAQMGRTIQDVLSGAVYADGAVGGVVMVRFKDTPVASVGEARPLTFNLNAAMPWQLELVPGLGKEGVDRLIDRLEKRPLTRLDELAGTIPSESYAALEEATK